MGALIAPVQPFEALRFAIIPIVERTENHVRSDAISLTAASVFHEVVNNSMGSRLTSFPFQGIFP
jgi:hypothetical protein